MGGESSRKWWHRAQDPTSQFAQIIDVQTPPHETPHGARQKALYHMPLPPGVLPTQDALVCSRLKFHLNFIANYHMKVNNPNTKSLSWLLMVVLLSTLFFQQSAASLGDRLPDFRECVKVCENENCGIGRQSLPLHLRLLLWTCSSECDYTCQHVITDRRVNRDPPMISPIVQYHGKWPFYRFMGIQEPFSVLFSLMNFLAHQNGMAKVRELIPSRYRLRPYYLLLGYFGLASWIFSMIFHTRDFGVTEKADYFAAGASVLYGLYYTPIRIFRLDKPAKENLLWGWSMFCIALYVAHVLYLTVWSWDYTYNMAANVVVGIAQNVLWTFFSITRYRKLKQTWTIWPGLIIAWITLAMSLELFDFPPIWGMVDAHSLWHLGTVVPTIWWYNFLIKDAQEDLASDRLKA